MEKEKVLAGVTEVFDEVFANHGATISESTTAQDIQEWDSLTNIELLVAIEQKFGIKFKSSDISQLQNVGDLCEVIQKKLHANS